MIDSLIGRFRGNLVIDAECDHKPYEEETWTGIRIGATHFKVIQHGFRNIILILV